MQIEPGTQLHPQKAQIALYILYITYQYNINSIHQNYILLSIFSKVLRVHLN